MDPYWVHLEPGRSPSLTFEKWSNRYVIKMLDLWNFFLACGGVYGPGYQSVLEFALSPSQHEMLFNPSSPFGRAVLKLPILTRIQLLALSLSQGSFFNLRVTQRRVRPLLKAKKKRAPLTFPPPITFIPPLYLPLADSPSYPLPPSLSLSIHNTFSYHYLNFVHLLFQFPRLGIG